MNPILVFNMLLGYLFNLYRGKPLVREGGVLIGTHPMPDDFDKLHHPSYIDLWNEVFPETNDVHEIHRPLRGEVRQRPLVPYPLPQLLRLPRRTPFYGPLLGSPRPRPPRRRHTRRRRPREHQAHGAGTRRHRSRRPPDGPGHRRPEPEHDLHAHPTPLHVRGELGPESQRAHKTTMLA